MLSRKDKLPNMELVDDLLARPQKGAKLIAKAVCDLACRWNQPALWNRAITACSAFVGEDSTSTYTYGSYSDDEESSDCDYCSDDDDEPSPSDAESSKFLSKYCDVSGEGYYSWLYETERVLSVGRIITALKCFGFQAITPGYVI